MKVPSGQSPQQADRTPKTRPVDQMFKEPAPKDTFPANIQDVYYKPSAQTSLLSEVSEKNQQVYRKQLQQAIESGALTPEQAAKRQEAFESGRLGPYQPREAIDNLSSLQSLRDLENEQFCLVRHPQQTGDGLYRPVDFYVSPGHLTLKAVSQGWETSPDQNGEQIPVADAVVIGAGPGGLTTAWHLARRGGRVVCFESELAGTAFSDAGAKPVHHMRTSVDLTNLVREGHSHATIDHPLSLSGNLSQDRAHARQGREGYLSLTGREIHGVPEDSLEDYRNSPATRGELYNHLSNLAYSLAHDFESAVLSERSPVQEVTFEDGLFTVTTSRGHRIKAKELVLSTGLTGTHGEKARMLKVLDEAAQKAPDQTLILGQASDPQAQASALSRIASGEEKRALVVNDRLLGDESVRQTLASLPEGSKIAMVGSGESAIKGALEIAHLNPQAKVDLFVKDRLEVAQVQVPAENFHQAVIEGSLDHPERSKEAFDTYRFFGTPVTPRSLEEIFELQQSGRVRLLELGSYFDENSMTVDPTGQGTLALQVQDSQVQAKLAENHNEALSKGLVPPSSEPFQQGTYAAVIQGVGYQATKLEEHPLAATLPEEAKAHFHVNTVANGTHPSQTALPGLSTQGRRLAEKIAAQVVPDERRIEITVPQDYGIDWREEPDDVVDGIIRYRGVHPGFARAVERAIREDGSHPQEHQLLLTEADEKVRELAQRNPDSLTPAEAEVLKRGVELAERMKARAEGRA